MTTFISLTPTQGAYQRTLRARLVRETATLIVVRPDTVGHDWAFSKKDGLRTGADKNEFPRYQLPEWMIEGQE